MSLKEFREVLKEKLSDLPTFYSILKNEKLLKDGATVGNQDFILITDLKCDGTIEFEINV